MEQREPTSPELQPVRQCPWYRKRGLSRRQLLCPAGPR